MATNVGGGREQNGNGVATSSIEDDLGRLGVQSLGENQGPGSSGMEEGVGGGQDPPRPVVPLKKKNLSLKVDTFQFKIFEPKMYCDMLIDHY